MFEKLEITRLAQALAAHQGARLGVIARNMANADTPGYKAMDLPSFSAAYGEGSALRTTRAGHIGDATGHRAEPQVLPGPADPNGNSVSLEREIMRSADARQSHEMALAIYRATSDVVRASLGRR